jgi:LPS-assembly lipoprotein
MWLSNTRKVWSTQRTSAAFARRVPAFASVVVLGAVLAGCGEGGFRPMNASVGLGGANVEAKLATVLVAPIPGRLGQRVRNELIFDTTGGAAATTEPAYRLEMAVKETVTSTLVKTDGDALSQIYSVDATFNLIRLSDKKVVLKGVSYGRAGFERNPSIFSNVRAQDDAQNRVAHTIGLEMRTRLAAFLSTAS